MNKIYDLIHLNGFSYMVRDDFPLDNEPYIRDNKVYEPESGHGMCDCRPIIATTDPSLNLPLLPPFEEKISYKGFNAAWKELIDTVKNPLTKLQMFHFTERAKELWKGGYKAASAKKYTEEDMRKAFKEGRKYYYNRPDDVIDQLFNMYLQSLNPLPKQVEVMIVGTKGYMLGDGKKTPEEWINTEFGPKIENNFVKVIRYI